MSTNQFPKSRLSQKQESRLPQTLEALASPANDIARIDLEALSNLDTAGQERFRAVWQGLALERRQELATALLEVGEDRFDLTFADLFRLMLGDEDAQVRAKAVEGLWEDDNVRQIVPLLNMLQSDPSVDVRVAVAISLGRFVLLGELEEIDPRAAQRVENALRKAYTKDEHSLAVRRRILESLSYSGQDDVEGLILEAYRHGDRDLKISAVFAMGRNASQRWNKTVLAELSNPDAAIRYEAVRASGELALEKAVPALIGMLGESDVDLRDSAVWSLGQIGGQQAQRALKACARSEDEGLREAAQEALAELDLFADLEGFGSAFTP